MNKDTVGTDNAPIIPTSSRNISSQHIDETVTMDDVENEEECQLDENILRREEVADKLAKEIGDDDAHLNITLEEEKEYLQMYKKLLGL